MYVASDLMFKQIREQKPFLIRETFQIREPFLAHPSIASDPEEAVQNRQVSDPWITERM